MQALDLLPHRIRLRWYIDKNEIQRSDPRSGLHNRSISFIGTPGHWAMAVHPWDAYKLAGITSGCNIKSILPLKYKSNIQFYFLYTYIAVFFY